MNDYKSQINISIEWRVNLQVVIKIKKFYSLYYNTQPSMSDIEHLYIYIYLICRSKADPNASYPLQACSKYMYILHNAIFPVPPPLVLIFTLVTVIIHSKIKLSLKFWGLSSNAEQILIFSK